jgi:hypothetical protein
MWVFLIVSILFLVCTAVFMHKNITKIEFYISYLFMLILSWSINVAIDVIYNLQGFFEKGPDYPTVLIYMIIFPSFGVVFLNFYPDKQQIIIKKTIYLLCSVLIMLGYDSLLIKFNILHYYRWTYVYSLLIYSLELLCILLNIKIVRCLGSVGARKESGG